MQPAKLGEVEQLLVGRIAGKSVAPLDWRSNQLKIGNWRGLVEECISSSADPFGMLAPRPRVSADTTESDEEDLKELFELFLRAADKKRPVAVADDKKRRRKPERDTRVANDSMPSANESVSDWLNQLPVRLDMTRGPRKTLFDGLRAYAGRFGGKQFSDLATADRRTLALFVNRIQEAA
jgi:hypothetical protein